jgi:hypothetical protein
MSGYAPDGRPVATEKDPVLRFLGGCALVFAILAAIVIAAVLVVGWRLTRDETPGRAEEPFLLGDETRYWCFDLKPDDAGLAAVLDKINASAEAARDEALENSPLRMLAFGRRRNQVEELFPLKLELAEAPGAWSGRATFSKGTLRMRAAVKILRWFIGRASKESDIAEAGGVEITTIRDARGWAVSMAMVGNRLLLAGEPGRLERALSTGRAPDAAREPAIDRMHAAIRLPGEDGWGFAAGPLVASFDVDASDALVFRIVAPPGAAAGTAMSSDEAIAVARSFLPYVGAEAFRLDDGSPARRDDGSWLVAGRIPELSGRVGAAFLRFSARRAEGPFERRTPSANPIPPSRSTSSDPRTDTPAAPKRGETPTPAH